MVSYIVGSELIGSVQVTTNNQSARNLSAVNRAIELQALGAGRRASDITLCAVSKTFDANYIRPVINAGQRTFGENRVQEAEAKWSLLKREYSDLELHLIGPLQTNKVSKAVALFDVIQTVDRPKLASAISKEIAATKKLISCYVQVNTGEETQKAGVSPSEAPIFVKQCENEFDLKIVGLMCIPPQNEEPTLHFAKLREIALDLGLKGLSMGMSADYRAAINYGATIVRVGSAVFGPRMPIQATAAD